VYVTAGDDLEGLIDLQHPCQLRGAYTIEKFVKDGRTELSAAEAPKRWRIAAIDDYCHTLHVRRIDESHSDYAFTLPVTLSPKTFWKWRRAQQKELAGASGTLKLEKPWSPDPKFTPGEPVPVQYDARDSERLQLDGNFGGEHLSVTLKRIPNKHFALYNPEWR
jgi:hypothetical protein